jgi:hypothetical protein
MFQRQKRSKLAITSCNYTAEYWVRIVKSEEAWWNLLAQVSLKESEFTINANFLTRPGIIPNTGVLGQNLQKFCRMLGQVSIGSGEFHQDQAKTW